MTRTRRRTRMVIPRPITLRGRFARDTGPKHKFLDTSRDVGVVGVAGTVSASINLIVQGATDTTRVGRKVTIRSVSFRGDIKLPSSLARATTSDIVRIILFVDKQCNGANAAVLDILETAAWNSYRNLANTSRFIIFMDRFFDVKSPAGSGDSDLTETSFSEDIEFYKFHFKCAIPLEFDAAAGAITDLTSNNFAFLDISKSGLAGIDRSVRLRFTDD